MPGIDKRGRETTEVGIIVVEQHWLLVIVDYYCFMPKMIHVHIPFGILEQADSFAHLLAE